MEGCLYRGWGPMFSGCGGTGGIKRKDVALSSPGCARYTCSNQSAIGPWDWGFYTVQRGVYPGELDYLPRVVGVVEIWKDSCTGDGANPPWVRRDWGVKEKYVPLYSPGCARSTRPSQPAIGAKFSYGGTEFFGSLNSRRRR